MNVSTLADLIAQVESNGNSYAVRFEPKYTPAEHAPFTMMELCKCNFTTAKVLCAVSWGKFQVMGDMLIRLGLNVSPFKYMADDAMQNDFFGRYMAADRLTLTLDDVLNHPQQRALFVRLWNGPGNIDGYSARLLAVAKEFGLSVTP